MINCQDIGQIAINGHSIDLLTEYTFISACLRDAGIPQKDLLSSCLTGIYKNETQESGKNLFASFKKIDEMVAKVFEEEETSTTE